MTYFDKYFLNIVKDTWQVGCQESINVLVVELFFPFKKMFLSNSRYFTPSVSSEHLLNVWVNKYISKHLSDFLIEILWESSSGSCWRKNFTQISRVKMTVANPTNLIFEDVERIHFYNSKYWWIRIIFLISLRLCSHNFYHRKRFLFHILDS